MKSRNLLFSTRKIKNAFTSSLNFRIIRTSNFDPLTVRDDLRILRKRIINSGHVCHSNIAS